MCVILAAARDFFGVEVVEEAFLPAPPRLPPAPLSSFVDEEGTTRSTGEGGSSVGFGFQGGGLAFDDSEAAFDGVVGGVVSIERCNFAVVQLVRMCV